MSYSLGHIGRDDGGRIYGIKKLSSFLSDNDGNEVLTGTKNGTNWLIFVKSDHEMGYAFNLDKRIENVNDRWGTEIEVIKPE